MRTREAWRNSALAGVGGLLLVCIVPASVASAHTGPPPVPANLWRSWNWDPLVLVGLLAGGLLYIRGLRALWQHAGTGRGVRRWQAAAYGLGLFTLFVALVTPLDGLSAALFAAHMVQHLLLILVAAPLLALGAPNTIYLWALAQPSRRRAGQWWKRRRLLRAIWHGLSWPPAVWALTVVALWLWHLPAFYNAALRSEPLHALEHLCFLVTSVLFWWMLFHEGRGRLGYGARMLYLFTMGLQSTILGALLTFSTVTWYSAYAGSSVGWGLAPLEDQQLAGLIMWIPAGAVYLLAIAALFVLWLSAAERAERSREHRAGEATARAP